MLVVVDCVGIRDGGGLRLLDTLAPSLCQTRPTWRWVFCVSPEARASQLRTRLPKNGEVLGVTARFGWLGRGHWVNIELPAFAIRQQADLLFAFANLAAIRPSVPTVLFVQQMKIFAPFVAAPWKERVRIAVLRRYVVKTIGAAKRVVVQSHHMRDLVINAAPEVSSRIDVIPTPVLPERDGAVRDAVATALHSAARPQVAFVSLPRTHKNHVTLVRAFARVLEEIGHASLLLTVEPPDSDVDDPVTAAIHSEVRALGIARAVVWLGLLNAREVTAVYDSMDAMVFPSLAESFGMPVAEALCARKAVMASDLPFAHEILGRAGAYFDPSSPEDIARVMLEVLDDPDRLRNMRDTGEAISKRFAPAIVAEQLCTLFESIAQAT